MIVNQQTCTWVIFIFLITVQETWAGSSRIPRRRIKLKRIGIVLLSKDNNECGFADLLVKSSGGHLIKRLYTFWHYNHRFNIILMVIWYNYNTPGPVFLWKQLKMNLHRVVTHKIPLVCLSFQIILQLHHISLKYSFYLSYPHKFVEHLSAVRLFWWQRVSAVVSGKTPRSQLHLPRTCRNKGKVWKRGQPRVGCFLLPSSLVRPLSLHLLHLLTAFLLPSQLFLLQVQLISLAVYWGIPVCCLLGYCFVCLSGSIWLHCAGCVWFLSGDY